MVRPHDILDPAGMRTRDLYRLMTDLVAPRPIAWISTIDREGRGNLAPFSYFQAVCSKPPTIVVGCGWRSDGTPKDTLRNILEMGEFTVNHVSHALAEAMNSTSAEYGPEVDEWAVADRGQRLAAAPAERVAAPRVAEALASLECRLTHAIPLGVGQGPRGGPSSTLVIAEVLLFTIAQGLLQRDGSGEIHPIDPARLASIGRLGGIAYTETERSFTLPRPKV